MPLLTFPKNSQLFPHQSLHFRAAEFDCKCTDCKETLIDTELIDKLEAMRGILRSFLKITSGYRCSSYQEQLRLRGYETSVGPSQHQLGKAADITNGVSMGFELEEAARKAGFKSVGVGKDFIHVDLRPEVRRWKYTR